MIKLYVDDHPNRITPDGWHRAWTVTEAIRILDTTWVSHISVDHDISIPVTVGKFVRPYPSEETFEPVFRFIRHMDTADRPHVTIHTANAPKAEEMRRLLLQVGINPDVRLSAPINGLENQ